MSSSPQHATPASSELSDPVTEDLALYREKLQRRLPGSLDDLHGPAQGVVELPLHIAWSGMTSYDMSKPRVPRTPWCSPADTSYGRTTS
ncbi:hypothetical protein ACWGH2_01680 [Streptomyces sp. NPDC054871]